MSDTDKKPDWFYTDNTGRRIGYIWPEDMLAIIDSIWGKKQGIKNFARYAGYSRTQVERWCNGKAPVPRNVALLVMFMQRDVISRQRSDRNAKPYAKLVDLNADWLPDHEPKFSLASLPVG